MNIFTICGIIVFILIIFIIFKPFNFKQTSNKENLSKLKKENTLLKQKIHNLKTEQSFYKDKYTNEINSIQAQNEGIRNEITKYRKSFEHLQLEIKNELVNSHSIFSPEHTKKGDKIAGLFVSDVKSKMSASGTASYHVNFTGEFEVKGKIITNEADGGYTCIIEENLEKIPHSLQEFEGLHFNILNENEFKKSLGDKIDQLPIEIVAVFKNYSYNHVPETDWGNEAEFVRLIPKN